MLVFFILYKFSQSLNCLTSQKTRITLLEGGSILEKLIYYLENGGPYSSCVNTWRHDIVSGSTYH